MWKIFLVQEHGGKKIQNSNIYIFMFHCPSIFPFLSLFIDMETVNIKTLGIHTVDGHFVIICIVCISAKRGVW